MKREPISKVVEDVREYILGYYTQHEYMPTLAEIAGHFSKNGKTYSREWARLCLKELERQGKIEVVPRKHRGILLK